MDSVNHFSLGLHFCFRSYLLQLLCVQIIFPNKSSIRLVSFKGIIYFLFSFASQNVIPLEKHFNSRKICKISLFNILQISNGQSSTSTQVIEYNIINIIITALRLQVQFHSTTFVLMAFNPLVNEYIITIFKFYN